MTEYRWLFVILPVLGILLFWLFKQLSPKHPTNTATEPPPAADPIAEAEVYCAYGRKQQAKQVLQTALDKDPNNARIREKLAQL